jgi:predicted nucleotidyltransferase component of viral defense system
MISESLIKKVSDLTKIQDTILLEKDLYLQGIIAELSESDYFRKNFVFKGGTCLTKAYFGYYRFSEDLDFTWINQELFEGKSAKQIRKIISKEIDSLIEIINKISLKFELDFKPDKSNKKYLNFGGSNSLTTLKINYTTINGGKSFIKLQVNFLEQLIYPIKKQGIVPIGFSFKERLDLEYPQYSGMLTKKSNLFVYDLREIASEKIRAVLTRKGFKIRDLIDLYKISNNGIKIIDVKASAIKKILFMLKYEKYSTNIIKKKIEGNYALGNESNLMITPIEKEYYLIIPQMLKELDLISKEIIEMMKNKI